MPAVCCISCSEVFLCKLPLAYGDVWLSGWPPTCPSHRNPTGNIHISWVYKTPNSSPKSDCHQLIAYAFFFFTWMHSVSGWCGGRPSVWMAWWTAGAGDETGWCVSNGWDLAGRWLCAGKTQQVWIYTQCPHIDSLLTVCQFYKCLFFYSVLLGKFNLLETTCLHCF